MTEIAIERIKPNDWNPNEMTSEEFAELVSELQHLGKPPKPIVLRTNGKGYEIIDGEHTYRALMELEHKSLLDGWYEIAECDDFEAMRQTYKRNQHGTHDPLKQGLLFDRMMKEWGLSLRGLADEVELSEGTIRNSLEYFKASKVRNDYAFSDLSVKQVRAYNRLPQEVGDLWLDCGANLKALYIDSSRLGLTKLQGFDKAMEAHYLDPEEAEEGITKHISSLGCLLELLPILIMGRSPESFAKAVEKVKALDHACGVLRYKFYTRKENHKLLGENGLRREIALPYLKVLAKIRWGEGSTKWLGQATSWALEEILRVIDGELKIVVPIDAFTLWVEDRDGWSAYADLRDGLRVLVGKFCPEHRKQNVREELMKLELQESAPPQIRDAEGISTRDKYELWEATTKYPQIVEMAGDKFPYDLLPEAVNMVVAELRRISEVEKQVDDLMLKDHTAAMQLAMTNHKGPIINILTLSLNRLIGENNRKVKDSTFKDKSSMIGAIVKGAQKIHSIREGKIAGKPASVVLAERLSQMELPELILLAGYIFDSNPEQRWINQLNGEIKQE